MVNLLEILSDPVKLQLPRVPLLALVRKQLFSFPVTSRLLSSRCWWFHLVSIGLVKVGFKLVTELLRKRVKWDICPLARRCSWLHTLQRLEIMHTSSACTNRLGSLRKRRAARHGTFIQCLSSPGFLSVLPEFVYLMFLNCIASIYRCTKSICILTESMGVPSLPTPTSIGLRAKFL